MSYKRAYLSELLNFEVNRRRRRFHWCPFWSNRGRLHLLLELVDLILRRPDSPPLPTQIPSPQCVDEQTTHHDGVYERKCPSLQYSKLPTDSKRFLFNHIEPKEVRIPRTKAKRSDIGVYLPVGLERTELRVL
jgi:hypothetical protein